ncbi:hypothetical protein Pcinc_020528 [Petrolisthes cinctipes]|uniref:Histamine H1 receptor n=1 Tax=Petrolisthes cinctipes TaxID=88211 RepID=A0AAE1KJL8_PETCI|nr:hypothetical protein Pcinc_020528 [Petrolisthes cinctipes]
MDAAETIVQADIDKTPFKTPPGNNNNTGPFNVVSGILPHYPPPGPPSPPHSYSPSEQQQPVLFSLGETTTCTPVVWWGTENTLDNLIPQNLGNLTTTISTHWNLSLEDTDINNYNNNTVEDLGPGWWKNWGPGLLTVTGLALYTLALCTTVGNALVIHAIRTEKRLQTVSNLFIMSLAAADLTVGVIVMPISAAYAMMGEWQLGLTVCQFWLAADYTASTASIFNLVILSLDRYWSITAPLRYLRRRTRRRAWVMIGASWTAAMAWLVPVLAWHHLALSGQRHHPPHVCETEFSDSAVFKAVTAALNFYLPTTLMVYLYCRIFCEVQSRQALGRIPFTAHDQPTDSCSEGDRLPRSSAPACRPNPSTHQPTSTTTTTNNNTSTAAISTCTVSSGSSERSQFRSLTVVSPSKSDCSHYSGLVVSIEYLPEESNDASSQPNQQGVTLMERRLRANGGRTAGHHQNHIQCFQSNNVPTPHHSCEKLGSSSWRLGNANHTNHTSSQATTDPSLLDTTNSAKKKRGGGSYGNNNSGGRRVDGVNLVKERKAARQLGMIVGAFLACWVPYFTLFPVMALCGTCVPPAAHTAAIWLGYLNSTLNPVIYPLCNQNFRRAFARMLHLPSSRKSDPSPPAPHKLPSVTARH